MIVTTTTQREMIHWLWLWALAAIAVSVMQGMLAGQSLQAIPVGSEPPAARGDRGVVDPGKPIPMPNVDHPDWFRYPDRSPLPTDEPMSLKELLQFHRLGDFHQSLKGWQRVRPLPDSETWRNVGIGVALLKLERHDEAMEHFEAAVEQDPNNAVAEYFMGRVRQAQGRQLPFWYETEEENPFRLASVVRPVGASGLETPPGKARSKKLLPHYIDDAYDRLARQHFRQAITLAPRCDLNQEIRIVSEQPEVIQLANLAGIHTEVITVRELLESLGEVNYVRRCQAELGVSRGWDSDDSARSVGSSETHFASRR